jgi:hypothetical protein
VEITTGTIRLVGSVVALLILTASGARAMWLRKGAESWPVTQGKILYGHTKYLKGMGYVTEMTYSFSIPDGYYSGTFIHPAAASEEDADEYALAMKYRKVKVRYQPGNPDRSFGSR